MNHEDRKARSMAWYMRISEEARVGLALVGVTFEPQDIWSGQVYFRMNHLTWYVHEGTEDPEALARRILDEIAHHARVDRTLAKPT